MDKIRASFWGSICVVMALLCSVNPVWADQFANPLDVRIADPQVLFDNGKYYLYGTSAGHGFQCWESPDLVNWRFRGLALYVPPATGWGQTKFWAPEVVKHNGFYYMVYSASGGDDGYKHICIARATSPTGPFTDIAAPLFDNGQGYIDGHIFFDTDGTPYLYCVQDLSDPPDDESHIWVARLNSTFTGLVGGLTHCISPSAPWEGPKRFWNEAPFVLKHDGFYFLLYSAHVYSSSNYAIGYATAPTPLGPWTKFPGNPIVKKTATVSGPGHCAVTQSPDGTEQWLVYHTHQQWSGGGPRQLAIDRLEFVDQPSGPARLLVPGAPSSWMIDAPSGAPPFPTGGSDEFNGNSLARARWNIFNEAGGRFNVSGGVLDITTVDGDIFADSRANWENIFLQYPPWEDFEITTKVNFSPGQNFEQAALFVWQDHNNYIRFSDAWIAGRKFEVGVEIAAEFTKQQVQTPIGSDCWMRIRKRGNSYTFFASGNGVAWTQVGTERTANLIDIRVGLGASSTGSDRRLHAKFDYFRVEKNTSDVADWSVY